MPADQNQNQQTNTTQMPPVTGPAPVVIPEEAQSAGDASLANISSKILDAHNVLIALSSDPSVDEMAAAIGLSICLDRAGKRATAIYSGVTPNALEFLKPEETFEATSDTLQDFVIALNKDKADHLRYKLDGDFVKIFITPYKSRISDEDLEFSYGDFNIDLVLSLNVANGVDLDSALREHGRIMHDATVINITTGNPGKFGEIEWSDKASSSVSEMTARLLFSMSRKIPVEADDATAFLTGIIAATNRFSNAKTTPESLKIASRLLEAGANQQLITENLTSDLEHELLTPAFSSEKPSDPDSLDISHDEDEKTITPESSESPEPPESSVSLKPSESLESSESLASSKADEPASVPDMIPVPEGIADSPEITSGISLEIESSVDSSTEPKIDLGEPAEKVVAPSSDFLSDAPESANRYGQMLEEALAASEPIPEPIPAPESASAPEPVPNPINAPSLDATPTPSVNPAAGLAPAVASEPEINGVPEMNYMPMPDETILPPPPTPPIDLAATNPLPPAPEAPETPETPAAPAMPNVAQNTAQNVAPNAMPNVIQPSSEPQNGEPNYASGSVVQPTPSPAPSNDASAFKIPGLSS